MKIKKFAKRLFSAVLTAAMIFQGTSTYVSASQTTVSIFDNKTYTHSDVFDGMYIYNGIDVSYHNKTIDWNSVKAAGVDYAFIRSGYRGYGSTGKLCTDTKFKENIENAIAAGVKVGVYYFTEAINTDEAIEEALYCIEQIKDYDVTLPIVIDYEYPTDGKSPIGRMYNAKLSKTAATNNCIAFCETVKEAGYTPMIYANKSDFTSLINGAKLGKSYKIWLANYTTKSTYNNTYEFWQYTSSGKVDGITGKVDCNFWYSSSDLGIGTPDDNDNPDDTNSDDNIENGNTNPDNNNVAVDNSNENNNSNNDNNNSSNNNNSNNNNNNNNDNNENNNNDTTNNDNNEIPATDLSSGTIASIANQSYTGSPIKPEPAVTLNGNTLKYKTDYTFTYSNNTNTGVATITVNGIGSYTGTITSTFIIKPKKITGLKAQSAKKAITLSWDGKNGAQGYQIYRKDSYNGAYSKIKTIQNGNTVSFKNSKLATEHEYYYKIRSFAEIDSKKYYSSYTEITAATMNSSKAAITSAKLNLLKEPGTDANVLITVPKNATLEYLGMTYLSDNTNYLHMGYVSGSNKYSGYLLPDATGFKYYKTGRTTTNLNIRKAAGNNKKILTVIPADTPIAIMQTKTSGSTKWYKTKYYNGSKLYSGFVSAKYVK